MDFQQQLQLEYFLSARKPCLEVLIISSEEKALRTTSGKVAGKMNENGRLMSATQSQHMKKAKEWLNELGGIGYIKDAKGKFYYYNNGKVNEVSKEEVKLN